MSLTRALPLMAAAAGLCFHLAAQTQVVQPARPETLTETRTLPLRAGSTLKINNTNGFIHVEAWDREEVEFKGEFKPSSLQEQVKVLIDAQDKGLTIRGEVPKHRGEGHYQGPVCRMTLRVPRRVLATLESVNGDVSLRGTQGTATLRTVNGGLQARELHSNLDACTVNGSIVVDEVQGGVTLKSVNGSIKAAGVRCRDEGVQVETVNGNIHFQVSGLAGRLSASTTNGSLSFEAPKAQQVELKKQRVEATLPGGDRPLKFRTMNGSIHLN